MGIVQTLSYVCTEVCCMSLVTQCNPLLKTNSTVGLTLCGCFAVDEKSPTVSIGMQLSSVMKREEAGGQRVKLCCAS